MKAFVKPEAFHVCVCVPRLLPPTPGLLPGWTPTETTRGTTCPRVQLGSGGGEVPPRNQLRETRGSAPGRGARGPRQSPRRLRTRWPRHRPEPSGVPVRRGQRRPRPGVPGWVNARQAAPGTRRTPRTRVIVRPARRPPAPQARGHFMPAPGSRRTPRPGVVPPALPRALTLLPRGT